MGEGETEECEDKGHRIFMGKREKQIESREEKEEKRTEKEEEKRTGRRRGEKDRERRGGERAEIEIVLLGISV